MTGIWKLYGSSIDIPLDVAEDGSTCLRPPGWPTAIPTRSTEAQRSKHGFRSGRTYGFRCSICWDGKWRYSSDGSGSPDASPVVDAAGAFQPVSTVAAPGRRLFTRGDDW